MAVENKGGGVGGPFRMFLKESIKQQRNAMMDKFS